MIKNKPTYSQASLKIEQIRNLVLSIGSNRSSCVAMDNRHYIAELESTLKSCRKSHQLQTVEITAKERNELKCNQIIHDFINQYADHWKNKSIKHRSLQECPIINRAMNHLEIYGEL